MVYQEAYKGIDLKFYGNGREMEYDIVVKPGADPGQVRFAYEGVKELKVTPEGDLALTLPDGGELIQKKPVVYQEIAGVRVTREGRFRVQGDAARLVCGFEVAAYDSRHPLVIDPVLVYSTYLGGNNDDDACAIAVDGSGNAYVTGTTYSSDFPTKNALYPNLWGTSDAFVTKIRGDGAALVWSTYLGGTSDERSEGIAVDGAGNAYVTGTTYSSDFPTKNALYPNLWGISDAFVTKIRADGAALVWSTYLGGVFW